MNHRAIVLAFFHAGGLVLVSACATTSVSDDGARGAGAPLGSLTVSGPTFGDEALRPTVCVTGERQFFLGFDLHDDNTGVVTRLVVDPMTGPIVRVFAASAPFDKTVLFHRSD